MELRGRSPRNKTLAPNCEHYGLTLCSRGVFLPARGGSSGVGYFTRTFCRRKVGTSRSWPSMIVGSLFSKRPRVTGSKSICSCFSSLAVLGFPLGFGAGLGFRWATGFQSLGRSEGGALTTVNSGTPAATTAHCFFQISGSGLRLKLGQSAPGPASGAGRICAAHARRRGRRGASGFAPRGAGAGASCAGTSPSKAH